MATSDLTLVQSIATVLQKSSEPLTAQEIARRIADLDLFRTRGATLRKSVDAKLSIEIKQHGHSSQFVRCSPGRFALRREHGNLDDSPRVLVVPAGALNNLGHFHGISQEISRYCPLLDPSTAFFLPRLRAENDETYKQIVSFALVKHSDCLLTFSRSHSHAAIHPFSGQLWLGFGGHVEETDRHLFSQDDSGYLASLRRELLEEIGLELGRYQGVDLRPVGVLNDDSTPLGRQHLAFVHLLDLTGHDFVQKQHFYSRERGFQHLRLTGIDQVADRFARLQYWSKLCVQQLFPERLKPSCTIEVVNSRRIEEADVVLVAGHIGSGKSEACVCFKELGYTLISCSTVLRNIIGCPPEVAMERQKMQDIGFDFISQPTGHRRLALGVLDEITRAGGRCVLDGLRYPETLYILQELLGTRVAVVFVEATIDNMHSYYRERDDSNCSMPDFLRIVGHRVEQRVERFLPEADAIVYNHGSKPDFIREIRSKFQRLLKGVPRG